MEFIKYVYNLQAFTHKFIENWEIIRGNALSSMTPTDPLPMYFC